MNIYVQNRIENGNLDLLNFNKPIFKGNKKEIKTQNAALNSADCLLNYNKPMVSRPAFKHTLSDEEYEAFKQSAIDIINKTTYTKDYKKELIDGLFNQEYSREIVSFFVNATKMDIKSVKDYMFLDEITAPLYSLDSKSIKQVLNSDFYFWLVSESLDEKGESHFSQGLITEFNPEYEESREKLLKVEKLFQNDVMRKYIKSEIQKNKKTICNYSYEGFYLDLLLKDIAPVEEFCNLENSKIFYSRLKDRNSDDIKELVKIIKPEIEGKKEKETIEFYEAILPLLSAKAPNGDYVFTSSVQSDTGRKSSISGIKNILKAKKENPDKYHKLMNYLKLTEQGKIPSYILSILPKEADINGYTDKDIEKRFSSKNSDIIACTNKEEGFKNSKPFDVVKIGDELFYRNNEELIPLKISEETFKTLFPNVEQIAYSQGQNGNCYFVSAIYDLMKNPDTRGVIYQAFEEKEGVVSVTIPDFKDKPVNYTIKDFENEGNKNINAALGIKLVEDAYSKTRKEKYSMNGGLDILNGGNQFFVYNAFLKGKKAHSAAIVNKDELEQAKKEGIPENAARITVEDEIDALIELNKKIKEIIDKYKKEAIFSSHLKELLKEEEQKIIENEEMIACLQKLLVEMENVSFEYLDKESVERLLDKFADNKNLLLSGGTKPKCDNEDKMLYGAHAYSINKIDAKNKTIDLVNPWNTAVVITLTFDEFIDSFDAIDYMEV